MPIRVLPPLLVNKIAAGEVIERPASVAKELVENALDAGATRIEITVEDGGRGLISVADDGAGMDAADLAMTFVPHATSKIADEDDLWKIHTMGFRGEALASMASVSQAHVRTCRRDAAQAGGLEVEASGPTVGPVRPAAAPPGTTVTIRNLFFNTPARRKFMRSAATELGHISEALARLALPHPQVAFRLVHNGRVVTDLRAVESTLARAADLFGPEFRDVLLSVPRRDGPVQVAGLIAAPSAARTTARWQYFFLNGRYIRDRLLSHALREAYRGLADPSRYPPAFLFLQVDPAEVDVNVHPTKVEVRFRDSQAVHAVVLASLRETLNRRDLAPSAELSAGAGAGQYEPAGPAGAAGAGGGERLADDGAGVEGRAGGEGGAGSEGGRQGAAGAGSAGVDDAYEQAIQQRRASLRQAMADFFRSQPPPQARFQFGGAVTSRTQPPATLTTDEERAPARGPAAPCADAPPSASVEGIPSHSEGLSAAEEGIPSPSEGLGAAPSGAMQIHNAYIVAACEDGLVIIDQHALHERVLYNDFRRRLASGRLASQRMLIPPVVQMTPAECSRLLGRGELLGRLGVELASFGPDSLAVQQFPALLTGRGVEPAEFLREVADRLADNAQAGPEQLLEDLLAILACKAAIKAGQPLSAGEMDMLLAQRDQAEKASACPHGRPTTLRLTLRDLQRQFHRT